MVVANSFSSSVRMPRNCPPLWVPYSNCFLVVAVSSEKGVCQSNLLAAMNASSSSTQLLLPRVGQGSPGDHGPIGQ